MLRGLVVGVALVMALFLALPLVALGVRAVQSPTVSPTSVRLLTDALSLSATTSAWAVGLGVVFGLPLAYALARGRFWGRGLVRLLVELPIVLPPAVAGLGLLLAYGRRGLVGAPLDDVFGLRLPFTMGAVVLAQVFVAAPFFIRSAQVGFAGVPRDLEDAARVDGAGGWAVFWHIQLPLAAPSVLAGTVLMWARAVGEFGATLLFAGSLQGRTQTMPLLIYNALESDLGAAVQAAWVLIGVAVVALLVAQALERRTHSEAT
jgi:molybdate transport system permease protein